MHPYIVNIQSAISYIFTDNRAVIDDYINKNGLLNDNKFKVHIAWIYPPSSDRDKKHTTQINPYAYFGLAGFPYKNTQRWLYKLPI